MNLLPMISIVDDDESVRIAIDSLVRSLGYQTRLFASAREFIDFSVSNTTSCLITDIQMPEIDGLQMHRTLTAQGHDIPVIFMTAFAHDSVRKRALSAGAIAFMSKPFNTQHMIEHIHTALGETA